MLLSSLDSARDFLGEVRLAEREMGCVHNGVSSINLSFSSYGLTFLDTERLPKLRVCPGELARRYVWLDGLDTIWLMSA